jgi:hypothetical protein
VNRALAKLNSSALPVPASWCSRSATVLAFTSALNFLIIFAGTVIAAVYFASAAAVEPPQPAQRTAPVQEPPWPPR